MRKVATIIAVVLFFLLIMAAILFKLFKPSTTSTQSSIGNIPTTTQPIGINSPNPEEYVKSFYQWYLLNFSRDPLFPHPENRDEILSQWLTNDFLSSWDEIQSETDMNPVLLTADDPGTWGTIISTRVVSQSIRSSIVYVTIGSGSQIHTYNVGVVQNSNDGMWKVDSVASAD